VSVLNKYQLARKMIITITRKKSCLGCDAVEAPIGHWGTDFCRLGYKTERIEVVAGFYGAGHQAISCNCKPAEECPKPRTVKRFIELYKEKSADKEWARERMGIISTRKEG
jgi:hypothetical protein